jgi:hypothetical protein
MPTKEQIEAIIKELQKIMRIQDWGIGADIVNQNEMKGLRRGETPQGTNLITRCLKRCTIYINKDDTENWYQTLCHELMHVVIDPILWQESHLYQFLPKRYQEPLDETFMTALEQSVDELSKMFISLYPVTNFDHILKEESK